VAEKWFAMSVVKMLREKRKKEGKNGKNFQKIHQITTVMSQNCQIYDIRVI
jgi:hypothetical protein